MRNCVYRFFNKEDEIIYVGRTSQGVKKRMKEHFNSHGHLDPVCYKNVHKINYCTFQTSAETKIYEIYLINKYKPIYNTADKEHKNLKIDIDISNLKWIDLEFVSEEEKTLEEKDNTISMLRNNLHQEQIKRSEYQRENKQLEERIAYLESMFENKFEENKRTRVRKERRVDLRYKRYEVESLLSREEFKNLEFSSAIRVNNHVVEKVIIKNIEGFCTYKFEVLGDQFPKEYLSNLNMNVISKLGILGTMDEDGFMPTNISDKQLQILHNQQNDVRVIA